MYVFMAMKCLQGQKHDPCNPHGRCITRLISRNVAFWNVSPENLKRNASASCTLYVVACRRYSMKQQEKADLFLFEFTSAQISLSRPVWQSPSWSCRHASACFGNSQSPFLFPSPLFPFLFLLCNGQCSTHSTTEAMLVYNCGPSYVLVNSILYICYIQYAHWARRCHCCSRTFVDCASGLTDGETKYILFPRRIIPPDYTLFPEAVRHLFILRAPPLKIVLISCRIQPGYGGIWPSDSSSELVYEQRNSQSSRWRSRLVM